jgi:hypothetical protein
MGTFANNRDIKNAGFNSITFVTFYIEERSGLKQKGF